MKYMKLGVVLLGLCMSGLAVAKGVVNVKNGIEGYKVKWTIRAEKEARDFFPVIRPEYTKEYSGTLAEGPSDELVKSLPSGEYLRSIKFEWLGADGKTPAYEASYDLRDKFGNVSNGTWKFELSKTGVDVYDNTDKKRPMKLDKPLMWNEPAYE